MKRCPKCSFLYLDSDEVCDLDGTLLLLVNDVDLEDTLATPITFALTPARQAKGRSLFLVISITALFIGASAFAGFFALTKMNTASVEPQEIAKIETQVPVAPLPSHWPTTPEPVPSPTPLSTPSPSPRSTRALVSNNPISTSASRNSPQGKATIRLTNGVRIDADEVWRTKDGVWYRRNGMVTLLKNSHVRSIEKGGK